MHIIMMLMKCLAGIIQCNTEGVTMVQLNVMRELWPVQQDNGKYSLPAASFNLTLEERRAICNFLRGSEC